MTETNTILILLIIIVIFYMVIINKNNNDNNKTEQFKSSFEKAMKSATKTVQKTVVAPVQQTVIAPTVSATTNVVESVSREVDSPDPTTKLINGGYSCSYYNGKIALKPIDNTVNINEPPIIGNYQCYSQDGEYCKTFADQVECNAYLTKTLDGTFDSLKNQNCAVKYGTTCDAMFNTLNIPTMSDANYQCYNFDNPNKITTVNINDIYSQDFYDKYNNNVIGKIIYDNTDPKNSRFVCASTDGINCVTNCKQLYGQSPKIAEIACQSENDQLNMGNNKVCKMMFDNYNFYKTDFPFAIYGDNVNQDVKNIITDEITIDKIVTNNNNVLSELDNYDPNTLEGKNNGLNGILKQYPLKVGCCNRKKDDNAKQNATVYVGTHEDNTNEKIKKLGFQWANIDIPAETCPTNLYDGSQYCDTFYAINCANLYTVFKNNNKSIEEY